MILSIIISISIITSSANALLLLTLLVASIVPPNAVCC